MRTRIPHYLLAIVLLAGCDGPHEEAGEQADVKAGDSDTSGSLKSGPRERAGEKLDELEKTQAAP